MFLNSIYRSSWNILLGTVIFSFGLISCSNQQLNNFSTQALANDKEVKINSVAAQELIPIGTLGGHTKGVSSIAYSPDGKTLASCSYDNTIKLWNLKTMQEIVTFNVVNSKQLWSVAFTSDGKKLIGVGADEGMKIWNLDTMREIDFEKRDAAFFASDKLAINSDNIIATLTTDLHIKLWNLDTGAEIAKFAGHPQEVIYSLAFSPDEKVLATGSYDKTIKLWNLETGEEIKTLIGHRDWVFPIAFSPDGKLIASGSYDNTLRVWNLETGEEIRAFQRYVPTVGTLDFSPDGKTLVSGSIDNVVRLWSVNNMTEISTYTMPEVPSHDRPWTRSRKSRVNSVHFSPNGNNVAVASDDNTIIIFKVKEN